MEMTNLGRVAGQMTSDSRVAGDAVRYAMGTELLTAVADTIRFVCLSPQTWVSQRYTEPERDMLRQAVERLDNTHVWELAVRCPLCGAASCEDGCPVARLRDLVEGR